MTTQVPRAAAGAEAAEPTGWRIAPGSRSEPLVIAHRGASGVAPENTLEAFRAAVEAGAHGVELDVRLTRDGHVVIMHDRFVDRTTDGAGPVGAFTLAQLKELDAGSWLDGRFAGCRVPALDEVLAVLPADCLVNVEIKARGPGVAALVSKVVDTVRQHGRLESTLVASFNPAALLVARLLEPRLARGYIWSARHPYPFRHRWFAPLARPHWMNPDRGAITPALVRSFHRGGRRVLAWDADARDGLTPDAIVTDHPGRYVSRGPHPAIEARWPSTGGGGDV